MRIVKISSAMFMLNQCPAELASIAYDMIIHELTVYHDLSSSPYSHAQTQNVTTVPSLKAPTIMTPEVDVTPLIARTTAYKQLSQSKTLKLPKKIMMAFMAVISNMPPEWEKAKASPATMNNLGGHFSLQQYEKGDDVMTCVLGINMMAGAPLTPKKEVILSWGKRPFVHELQHLFQDIVGEKRGDASNLLGFDRMDSSMDFERLRMNENERNSWETSRLEEQAVAAALARRAYGELWYRFEENTRDQFKSDQNAFRKAFCEYAVTPEAIKIAVENLPKTGMTNRKSEVFMRAFIRNIHMLVNRMKAVIEGKEEEIKQLDWTTTEINPTNRLDGFTISHKP